MAAKCSCAAARQASRTADPLRDARMLAAGATTMTEAFKASGLHSAMYAIPILAVAASVVLFAAASTVEQDIGKQRDV